MICITTIVLAAILGGAVTPQDEDRSKRMLENVTKMAGQPDGARRTWIEHRLDAAGVVWTRQPFGAGRKRGQNVIASLGPEDGPAIILSAHFDKRPTSHGANNDASGVAVLLEVMRDLAKRPPPRRVIALFLDASERGLGGSRAWIDEHADLPVLAAYHLEACGRGDTILAGPANAKGGNPAVADVVSAASGAKIPVRSTAAAIAGDHKRFLSAGIEAACVSIVGAGEADSVVRELGPGAGLGAVPGAYRAELKGRDPVTRIEGSALVLAHRTVGALVAHAAARTSGGLPLQPTFSRARREFLKKVGELETRHVVDEAGKLGHRGTFLALARGLQDPELAPKIRALIPKILAGKDLRTGLGAAETGEELLAAYARFARDLDWDPSGRCFRPVPDSTSGAERSK